jgi:hypothetical protein
MNSTQIRAHRTPLLGKVCHGITYKGTMLCEAIRAYVWIWKCQRFSYVSRGGKASSGYLATRVLLNLTVMPLCLLGRSAGGPMGITSNLGCTSGRLEMVMNEPCGKKHLAWPANSRSGENTCRSGMRQLPRHLGWPLWARLLVTAIATARLKQLLKLSLLRRFLFYKDQTTLNDEIA